jgi:hypothetical protein
VLPTQPDAIPEEEEDEEGALERIKEEEDGEGVEVSCAEYDGRFQLTTAVLHPLVADPGRYRPS